MYERRLLAVANERLLPFLLPAQHAERHVGAAGIEEAPVVADLDGDVIRLQLVIVGEARVEEGVAAITDARHARLEAGGGRQRRKQVIDVRALAHGALQRVGGRLVGLQLGAVGCRQARGVVADILDLGAAKIEQPFELLLRRRGVADDRRRGFLDVVIHLELRLVSVVLLAPEFRPVLVGRLRLIERVVDQQPGAHLIFGRHVRLFAKRRHVLQGRARKAVLLFLKRLEPAIEHAHAHLRHRPCVVAFKVQRLEIVFDHLHGNLPLELVAVVEAEVVAAHLAPAIFDDRPRLDRRHRKRLGFELRAADFDNGALKDGVFLQLDNRAIRLDRAPGDVCDLRAAEVRDVNLALRLFAALGKYFDANIMVEHGAQVAARGIVGDADFPEEGFGVGVGFDHRGFQRQVCRVNRLPFIARKSSRLRQSDERHCRQQGAQE